MLNVVLVDDNKIELNNILDILEQTDDIHVNQTFSNGEDAYNYLKMNNVDLIITDVKMPRMDGIELIKAIRADKMSLDIILISGYSDFEIAQKAIGLDVVSFVMKPIIDDQLETAVKKVVDKNKEKLMEKNKYDELLNLVKTSENILYGQYIRNIIAGNLKKDEECEFLKQIFNKFKSYCNVVFVIKLIGDDFKTIFANNCMINDELSKIKKTNISFYPTYMNEDEVTVAAVGSDCDVLIDEIISFRNKLIEKYDFNMVLVISTCGDDLYYSDRLYNECKKALDNISLNGNKIFICEGEESQDYNILDLTNVQNEVVRMVYENNVAEIKRFINKYLSFYSNEKKHDMRNFVYMYVNILEIILSDIGSSFDDIIEIKAVWKKLVNCEDIINLQNFLENLTFCVISLVNKSDVRTIKIVDDIKGIIAENYAHKISVDEIAKRLNFSKRHLQRMFMKNTGISIYEYLINYRIEKAKELIKNNVPVKEVAEKTGYSNYAYFLIVFKEKTGKTPKEYKDGGN